MKQFVTLVLAAIIGGFAFKAIDLLTDNPQAEKVVYVDNTSDALTTRFASNQATFDQNLVNFREASEKSVLGVVHVKSTIISQRNGFQYRQYIDPIEEFFWGGSAPRYYYKEPKQEEQRSQASGSGVIISSDGYIVTNNHVVEQADELEVTLHDNRTYKATIVGTDPSTDIALLKIDEEALPYIKIGNSDDIFVGDWVLAVGNPFNLSSTVTAGIVSAKARNINILQSESAIESFIQTDAAVNPGNSGGALVDLRGELIGVNTAIATPTGTYAGYSFAVPSNIVKKVVEDLTKYGNVQRAYIGIEIVDITKELKEQLNISTSEGVIVQNIAPNGAASEAGIEINDVIVAVNGNKVARKPELLEQIGQHRPGDKVNITVLRDNKKIDVPLTLKNIEGTSDIVKKDDLNVKNKLGVELKPLSENDLAKLNTEYGVQISKINSGIIKEHTNIREGFIITKIDNKPVKTAEDINKILQNKKGGVMIEGIYPGKYGKYYYAIGL